MQQFPNALIGAALALACLSASAQPATPSGVNQREAHQDQRIQ